jgi:hypothetical protein
VRYRRSEACALEEVRGVCVTGGASRVRYIQAERGTVCCLLAIEARYLAYDAAYACRAYEARGQQVSCLLSGGGGGYLVSSIFPIVYPTYAAILERL